MKEKRRFILLQTILLVHLRKNYKEVMKERYLTFSKRLTFHIVLALMLTLALVAAGVFYQASWIMGLMTSAYYAHVADIENESVEKKLHDVQVAINNSIDEVEWQLQFSPDSVYVALQDKLQLNPNAVLGFGAAFEPNFFPQKGRWFEPYAMWHNGNVEVEEIGSASHDYFKMEWYRKGMETDKGHWSDPYFDETGTEMTLCTYSVPIHDRKGRKVGVFGGDLSLDMLHDYLIERDLKANTEGPIKVTSEYEGDKTRWVHTFIVGRQGYYISHPDTERILRDNFFDTIRQNPDTVADRMVRDMMNGKKGFAKVDLDGVPVTVFYTPLEHTGWSLAVVLPDKRLNSVVIRLCVYLAFFLLLGWLAVYIICRVTIRRSTRPLHFLARSADEVAKGNFNAPLPDIRHNDEIRLLSDSFSNMQQSLSRYIDELQTTTAQKSLIESELTIARSIQMAMLPKLDNAQPPTLDIYASLTPAKAVGGDLYDFFVRDEKLFFCIGDVSGKGVPAALIMAMACGAFRLLAESESDPLRIVSRMNETMSRDNDLSLFVTFFVGVLDLATGHLCYCNAGHKAPYVLNSNIKHQTSLLPIDSNLPVGAMSDWVFTKQETVLATGTTLFLYTDGLDEAEDSQYNQFGKNRIGEALQATSPHPRTLIEHMTQAVGDFVGDTEQSDDLTMLVIQYKG